MTIPMKLWLDDKREPPDHTWTWACTGAWAIVLMSHFPCGEISFDHDLGLLIDGTEDKGATVADWIEEQVKDHGMPCPRWRVHSSNPPGRKYIELAMRSAERFEDMKMPTMEEIVRA